MQSSKKKSSEFSRTEYTEWLNRRRSELGLSPVEVAGEASKLMAWLRDAWSWIRDLPEAHGLSLVTIGERSELACEYSQTTEIAGRSYTASAYELLFVQRPPTADQFPAALAKASKNAESIREKLAEEVPHQVTRVRSAIEKDPSVVSDPSIRNMLDAFTYPQSLGDLKALATRIVSNCAEVAVSRRLIEGLGLRRYPQSFPAARARSRSLLFICGPTNSGKTYRAFEQISNAEQGVYLAPLRLMAAEFWDRLQTAGIHCSLITGEERIIDSSARHVSSTIEMFSPDTEYDVAVIDEVQMIADPDRGWAWTQAIVGVNAKQVILVGSPDAESVVTALAQRLEEPLEIIRTERLTPLEVAKRPYVVRNRAAEGTAFISFSRRDVLSWKETMGGARCAAIYGALSPEVRREEARRFAAGEAPVVSATDAIGMGLNLPVKTIVFTTLRKWNGTEEVELTDSQIRQIAGRAGRFGMHESGIVTALTHEDLTRIRSALATDLEQLPPVAPIAPHQKMLEFLSQEIGRTDLAAVLEAFAALPADTGMFRRASLTDMRELALELIDSKLPLQLQFRLAACPIDADDAKHRTAWRQWVAAIEEDIASPVPRGFQFDRESQAGSGQALEAAESRVRLLSAYKWLHHRMPDLFFDADEANRQSAAANHFISNTLKRKITQRCRSCGKALPPRHRFPVCDTCYSRRARGREEQQNEAPSYATRPRRPGTEHWSKTGRRSQSSRETGSPWKRSRR
ncbi:helicase-related protein [Verrucomicrobiota bacterium sgz303538]